MKILKLMGIQSGIADKVNVVYVKMYITMSPKMSESHLIREFLTCEYAHTAKRSIKASLKNLI